MIRWTMAMCVLALALAGCRSFGERAPGGSEPVWVTSIAGDPFAGAPPSVDASTTLPQRRALIAAVTGDKPGLLGLKSGINIVDPALGMTPLHIAVTGKEVDAVRRLLEAGANPNIQMSNGGPTPLYDAVCEDSDAMVALLLKHGARAEVRSRETGANLLHLTAMDGQTNIARRLIEAGADVNCANQFGVTPLHLAASNGHNAMIELLAKSGANVNARSSKGVTPLEVAERRPDRPETIALLKSLGAK
ncbi:ankyrin repeat domain-containing protein [bacterium]|nr:ankyrin repeat domain-containing protein [bacterium]